ncbi:Neu5Ac permease [Oligella ureolytica]|uniref:TRAP transporter small permease protein n=2 Tax=Oligella ureolytica TaxID=90244 RepID=A0A378XF82_9BURK|nr:TRAP transporter small permease subunit [Oligella ureolytica]QPT40559.1 TRAP transporter small permease subunit [Oligella ureolytica]SUA51497.1 Neu5Ac permease [Oligella ureolytica]
MHSLFLCFVNAITSVNRFFFRLASLFIFIIVFSMFYEVISRYIFHAPTTWGLELATLLFGPYFLLGGAYLLHLKGHVNLDIIKNSLPKPIQKGLEVFAYVVIIIFCFILFQYAYPAAVDSFNYKETTFSAWNPPLWPTKLVIPFALILLSLQSVAELIRLLIQGKEKPV